MSILVIAEHDNASVKRSTLSVVRAATNLGGEVHVLIAGSNANGAVQAAAGVIGGRVSRPSVLPERAYLPRWSLNRSDPIFMT